MNNFRIVKRKGKFYIQERSPWFYVFRDIKRNNNPAYAKGCPPFDTPEEAKEWLSEYVKYHTDVIYNIHLIAHS